jgi:4-amino-4-deoxy-L-arabinose transferase-like glycosyltransferase
MILNEIFLGIVSFWNITIRTDAFWIILPLAISALLMIIYFGIYEKEKTDWNTHLSNSFILIFVSIALFKYIYSINDAGSINFIEYWFKTSLVFIFLAIGLFLVRFNFEHLLPLKLARYINSPLTVNLCAYIMVLLVYSTEPITWIYLVSLLIIILFLVGILILIKIPSKKIAEYMEKEKEKERITDVKEAVFEVKELKEELKERKKELDYIKVQEIDKEKKKLKKIGKILKNKK